MGFYGIWGNRVHQGRETMTKELGEILKEYIFIKKEEGEVIQEEDSIIEDIIGVIQYNLEIFQGI